MFGKEPHAVQYVQRMVNNDLIDPSMENNFAIREAAQRGDLDMVTYLLSLAYVDPSANHDQALKSSILHKHVDIVKKLINDNRVGNTGGSVPYGVGKHYAQYVGSKDEDKFSPLSVAVELNNVEIVRLLMQHERFLDAYQTYDAIIVAANHNSIEAARELGRVLTFDTHFDAADMLQGIIYHANDEILRIIIGKVAEMPLTMLQKTIIYARNEQMTSVLSQLLRNAHIRQVMKEVMSM
jgi:hypothetical protein